jgi:hypothetical protein
MSFLSVLKDIGKGAEKVLSVAAPAASAVAGLIPGGSIISTILGSVVAAEHLVTTPTSGADKKAIAVAIINAVHPGLNQTVVSDAIDGLVSVLNALAAAIDKTPANPLANPPAAAG